LRLLNFLKVNTLKIQNNKYKDIVLTKKKVLVIYKI